MARVRRSDEPLLVFLDTEFTQFLHIDLISLALVPERGEPFYAERNDFRMEDCSDFVRAVVLPKLGLPDQRLTKSQLAHALHGWFQAVAEPVEVVYDYFSDWELLADALLDAGLDRLPKNLVSHLHLGEETLGTQAFRDAQEAVHRSGLERHHALADAVALCAGFQAWQKTI